MTTTAARETAQDATNPTVSVVAPAYNEERNLTPLVEQVTGTLDDAERCQPYEIILVDDGSTDGTAATVRHLSALFDPVRGIELKRNFGQSHALQAGIDHAEGDIIVTIDADLQNDPEDIPMLVDRLERDGVDCVSGRRVDRQDGLAKRVPSNIQTVLAKKTGAKIHDFGCTLKAYRADALEDVALYGEAHRYIPAMLHEKGHAVSEVAVNHRPRENGSSRYGMGRLVRGFVDLIWHWFWTRYGTRPMHVFGGFGLLCMAVAGTLGAWSLVDKFVFGAELAPHLPRLIATVGLGVFGLVLLVFGILAEMMTKLHYARETPYRVRETYE